MQQIPIFMKSLFIVILWVIYCCPGLSVRAMSLSRLSSKSTNSNDSQFELADFTTDEFQGRKTDEINFGTHKLNANQKKVVAHLLEYYPSLRVALLSDHGDSAGLAEYRLSHPEYDPYFVEGQIGIAKGFVIVFVSDSDNFAVVWFTQKKDGTYNPVPQWLTKKGKLSSGGIFVQNDELWIGYCFSCDDVSVFVWSNKKHRFVRSP